MSAKKIYGLYNDDEVMVEGCKTLIAKGVKVKDVYSPFPIHGLEKVLGAEWTKLAICAFMYGFAGCGLALWGLYYFMVSDWPMNIGGKPNMMFYQNIPSFVPIIFEFTVLCAAHGIVLTYLLRNWTLPGAAPRNPDPRTTDDHFAVEVDLTTAKVSAEEISNMFKETGVVEVFEK